MVQFYLLFSKTEGGPDGAEHEKMTFGKTLLLLFSKTGGHHFLYVLWHWSTKAATGGVL